MGYVSDLEGIAGNNLTRQLLQFFGFLDLGGFKILREKLERTQAADRLSFRDADARIALRPLYEVKFKTALRIFAQSCLVDQNIHFTRIFNR